jgi:hypothetical protein
MSVEGLIAAPEFSGSKQEQGFAAQVFRVFRAQGAYFSSSAPIRISLAQLVEYFEAQGGKAPTGGWETGLTKALDANTAVFAREDGEEGLVYMTTREGVAPVLDDGSAFAAHDLRERFTTPQPPRPVMRRSPELELAFAPDAVTGDLPTNFPFAADSWQAAVAAQLRKVTQDTEQGGEAAKELELADQVLEEVSEDLVEEAAGLAAALAQLAEAEELEETLEDELEELVMEAPAGAADVLDAATATDDQLFDAIRSDLGREPEVARWGDQWLLEANVPRLSRGDVRRVQEFFEEAEGPLTDVEIVEDLRGIRPNADQFELERFALNFRLSREVRDFEYVGNATEGLWATPRMGTIGGERRKSSEIGQDYRYLLDYRTPDEGIEEGIVEHVLTFYEYQLGVLPLDANVATIMPRPAFSEQRAARLTFELPQTGELVAAELRFPTSNRGGYIIGLEEFYAANLVPGALVTIETTDRDSHFMIEFFQMSRQDRKLLRLDERKGRYVFQNTTYYCATQEEMLLNDSRFAKLADAEPLDERMRRRPELVVAKTFERVGDNVGEADAPQYRAAFIDLLAAANVERPISSKYLRDILEGGAYPEFYAGDESDTYIYAPAAS